MKGLFFGIAIILTLQINAQNYLITFEGIGGSKTVSIVKIENLKRGTNLTLNGSDILRLTFTDVIDPILANQSRLKIYPNPMVENSTLEFSPPVSGDAKITIYNITGKPLAVVHNYLFNFKQGFRLSGLKKGFYVINILGKGYQFSGRLVSNGGSDGTISIEKVIEYPQAINEKQEKRDIKGSQSTVDMDYTSGEILKFTGTSGEYSDVVMDSPNSNKIVTFNFKGVPILSTSDATATSSTTAIGGGTVISDGGSTILARGICWATIPSPTISDNLTSDGTGTGNYISNITYLQPLTVYHVRAFATNGEGTGYGNEITFTIPVQLATISTAAVTSISSTAAISGGIITDNGGAAITARGICWAASPSPTISDAFTSNGTGTGSFTSNIAGLQPFTSYHLRAYATSSAGTAYGNDLTFTTLANVPSLTTVAASEITRTTATSGGNIISDGGATVSNSGICWSTSHNPSISGSHTGDGTANGSFASSITGLSPNTLYYIRAYATNSAGTAYGNEVSFTTNPVQIAALTTIAVTSISSATAISGGIITDNGGATITNRGVCWATTSYPTISEDFTSNGTGTGTFTSNITGLEPFTTYHLRAYATNSAGTAYGNDLTFTTLAIVPSLSTAAIANITRTTATSGGNITSDGGSSISNSGICWSSSHNPSISGSHTNDGPANGDFTSNITGLLPNTLYYIRAYATNSTGTAYGNEISFTTNPVQTATLTTTAVTSISSATAISGGIITDNGGATITNRGVCWATTSSPTINDNLTSNGTGTGSFTANITGLQVVTVYHVRAYATNSSGTAYGNELTFTTLATAPSITSVAAYDITRTTATAGGSIISNGGATISRSGICWSTSHNPSITGSHTNEGATSESFSSSITGLLAGTLYYIRAYATNSRGTSYGNELSFSTNPAIIPTISTAVVTNVATTTATSGGNITDDGDGTVTVRGICWATNPSPNISDNIILNGTGKGSFACNITGLQPVTVYHVRAFATNSAGTAYGNEVLFTTNPVQIATLTTSAVTSISSSTAVSGGNITDNGGETISVRGICWATTPLPTISDNMISAGTETGSFTGNITGLQHFTEYHVRAFATNSAGTAYGNELTFTTLATTPSITSVSASDITRTTATAGGSIISNGGATISSSGICWSTSHNPSITGSHTNEGAPGESFSSNITGLMAGTLYYIRAYATNNMGTSYGDELLFTTNPAIMPALSTAEVSSVGTITAVSGGNITDDGDGTITSRGICWATTPSPTVSDNLTSNGTGKGSFTSNITGLQPETIYHVRAYATNSAGTAYGNEVTFNTNPVQIPTLTTISITSITATTAISRGNVGNDGGGLITARGICWAESPSPTITDNITSNGTGTGVFTGKITGLQPFTSYHVRAYATNDAGTAYGNDLSFTTLPVNPTVTTSEVSAITQTTATAGGIVTANGGPDLTARGVCWSTSANPTIAGLHISAGDGDGVFTCNLTGLTANTRYYVRAYATNDVGTSYGDEVVFMCLIPEINPCKWLNDASCFLNLSFDDGEPSHLQIANMLSEYGFKGSFYTQSDMINPGSSLRDVYKTILLSGHEVGSHTVNHSDLTTLSDAQLLYQIDSSVSRINRYLNTNCTSFAHPFDASNDHINSIIFSRNLVTRNYSEYYPDVRPVRGLESTTQINSVTNFIDNQIAANGMCLIAGHGIDGNGYSPITSAFLIQLLNYVQNVQNNSNVWVSTMSNGALYESLFHTANITYLIDQSNRQINIQINLPDKDLYLKFDQLLFSFKISKSSSWSMQDSGIEYTESPTDYLFTIDLKQTKELTLQYIIN